mmetsp:Transcript_16038/g.40227  ORF Transcript_16038/g.40227 Transcript_16038/m.40227 type:complete len:363 (+) Transcript_16038:677-1765(+)
MLQVARESRAAVQLLEEGALREAAPWRALPAMGPMGALRHPKGVMLQGDKHVRPWRKEVVFGAEQGVSRVPHRGRRAASDQQVDWGPVVLALETAGHLVCKDATHPVAKQGHRDVVRQLQPDRLRRLVRQVLQVLDWWLRGAGAATGQLHRLHADEVGKPVVPALKLHAGVAAGGGEAEEVQHGVAAPGREAQNPGAQLLQRGLHRAELLHQQLQHRQAEAQTLGGGVGAQPDSALQLRHHGDQRLAAATWLRATVRDERHQAAGGADADISEPVARRLARLADGEVVGEHRLDGGLAEHTRRAAHSRRLHQPQQDLRHLGRRSQQAAGWLQRLQWRARGHAVAGLVQLVLHGRSVGAHGEL